MSEKRIRKCRKCGMESGRHALDCVHALQLTPLAIDFFLSLKPQTIFVDRLLLPGKSEGK